MLAYRKFQDWYRSSKFCESARSGLIKPIEASFRQLELRNLLPSPIIALEVFGGTGIFKTLDLVPHCQHLTHMEVDECLIYHARKVLPESKTKFEHVDSIVAINDKALPRSDYNLVHIDNPPGCFGSGYCENFDLFPEILNCIADSSVLIFNVWLNICDQNPCESWLARRSDFFSLEDRNSAVQISLERARLAYSVQITSAGFDVIDLFPVPHSGETVYLVAVVQKSN